MAGAYTDIVEIVAPSSVSPGETVLVTVKVKNIYTYGFSISVAATYEPGPVRFIGPVDKWVAAGATESWSGAFTMPSNGVTIHAYSSYWGEDHVWHSDDEISKDVSLAEVFKGTISKKELEHDGTHASIPAYNIPQDERGLVHIWGRNDTGTTQDLGIHWHVYDPDGVLVEDYSDWSYGHGAGKDHEFIGGRFDLDKVGTYTINIALSMNPGNPVIVDTYYGTLCTMAAAVPEPEVSQFSIVYNKV